MEENLLITARLHWTSLREAVDADDAAITVFKYSNMPAVGGLVGEGTGDALKGQNLSVDLAGLHLRKANGVMIAAWGEGSNDEVITGYKLLGVTRDNGPIITLLKGVMTLGTLACTVHPLTDEALTGNLWFDTITVTGGLEASTVEILDNGMNRICMLQFDTRIFDRLFLEYNENSGGPTAFNAIICGY